MVTKNQYRVGLDKKEKEGGGGGGVGKRGGGGGGGGGDVFEVDTPIHNVSF